MQTHCLKFHHTVSINTRNSIISSSTRPNTAVHINKRPRRLFTHCHTVSINTRNSINA